MHTSADKDSLPGGWHRPDPTRPVSTDPLGRRCVWIEGSGDFAVIESAVWDRLRIRKPSLTDEQLRALHHDDFAHGMLAAMRARPDERPAIVGLDDMRMSRTPPQV